MANKKTVKKDDESIKEVKIDTIETQNIENPVEEQIVEQTQVDVQEQSVKIDVNIIVEYGARIPDIAFEIQNRVKKAVESMTGLKVLEVNVHVQGVNTDIQNKEKEEIKEDKQENNSEE